MLRTDKDEPTGTETDKSKTETQKYGRACTPPQHAHYMRSARGRTRERIAICAYKNYTTSPSTNGVDNIKQKDKIGSIVISITSLKGGSASQALM